MSILSSQRFAREHLGISHAESNAGSFNVGCPEAEEHVVIVVLTERVSIGLGRLCELKCRFSPA